MANEQEHIDDVNEIFDNPFTGSTTEIIPTVDDLTFDNHGKLVELAMLFIDIKDSTHLVAAVQKKTAARMYKGFLKGITKIALDNDGEVRSFNGDGVLVAFAVGGRCNNAVRAAMQMIYFCNNILKPKFDIYKAQNTQLQNIEFSFGIGIDVGEILVVKGGIGGENNRDLVWVGNATNYAAKLAGLTQGIYQLHITHDVYSRLTDDNKIYTPQTSKVPGVLPPIPVNIWEQIINPFNFFSQIHRTSYFRYI